MDFIFLLVYSIFNIRDFQDVLTGSYWVSDENMALMIQKWITRDVVVILTVSLGDKQIRVWFPYDILDKRMGFMSPDLPLSGSVSKGKLGTLPSRKTFG